MKHVDLELERIAERLGQYPDPNEHAGLYAAQQALRWAAQPEDYASPFTMVTGIVANSEGCSAGSRRLPLSDSPGMSSDAA